MRAIAAGLALTASPVRSWSAPRAEGFREIELALPYGNTKRHALILIPRVLDPHQRHPGVVLLHGYTRRFKGRQRIFAWRDGYGLRESYRRLSEPDIQRVLPTEPFLTRTRIRQLRRSLQDEPFSGQVLICPSVPAPYFTANTTGLYDRYAAWLTETLLPAAREAAPLSHESARLGLAGVSMSGRTALEVIYRTPLEFAALSLMQPELRLRDARRHATALAEAFGDEPLRVISSSHDPYRPAIETFSDSLLRRGLNPRLAITPGPHQADWMQEVGSLETLLFHDRQLRAPSNPYTARRIGKLLSSG